ncbi:hypothetical protein [Pontibacter oryzae]|uniref:Uncharacterized protein n=1 Tax=Pontibacter oryzae TaxID=2304593 RepID=A0A399S2Z7_9BACT|nr:hypothetical protein [Pontibacter oryzae]RIJ37688.1 hypothetical protein D1627_11330 [Pontibacter oryzae]
MTTGINNVWQPINKALTIVNLILLAILTTNFVRYKEIKDKKVPVVANVFLLLFLSAGLVAALYSFR